MDHIELPGGQLPTWDDIVRASVNDPVLYWLIVLDRQNVASRETLLLVTVLRLAEVARRQQDHLVEAISMRCPDLSRHT